MGEKLQGKEKKKGEPVGAIKRTLPAFIRLSNKRKCKRGAAKGS